jgi:hypothetical protein
MFGLGQAQTRNRNKVTSYAGLEIVATNKRELTSYPAFEKACLGFTTGYQALAGSSKLIPTLGHLEGDCGGRKPLTVSVTHENDHNNHNGSTNFNKNIGGYVADFDYTADHGKWLYIHVDDSVPKQLRMRLDTLHFKKINVTGWPLQFGHLFVGVSDLTVNSTLGESVSVEFDLAVTTEPANESKGATFSGRRIILGALGIWPESPPRTNTSHFLEVDLLQTPGYSDSYHQRKYPLCADVPYDRCFYGDGRFAEGREVSYQTVLSGPLISDNTKDWTHVRVDLSDLFKQLRWVSPPNSWDKAELRAIYIGIESTGSTSTQALIRNYHVIVGS